MSSGHAFITRDSTSQAEAVIVAPMLVRQPKLPLFGRPCSVVRRLDLLTDPALLKAAQDEFRERTGGGIGGTKWVAPLLPKDFAPPVDLRWPEYIQTARGKEWWIPTPATRSGAGEPL
jgi:hypothetical protein